MKENAVRLQKFLADQGVCSRRKAEELIAAGRVEVDGERAELGQAVDPGRDRVTLDGKPCVQRFAGIPISCCTSRAAS